MKQAAVSACREKFLKFFLLLRELKFSRLWFIICTAEKISQKKFGRMRCEDVPLHSRIEQKKFFKIFSRIFCGLEKRFYLCSRFERKAV